MSVADRPEPPKPPTAIVALPITGVVILVIIGWVVLGSVLVGTASIYASFLFGWYWISVDEAAPPRWPPCVIGALVGLGFSVIVHEAPLRLGVSAGTLIVLLALTAMIYLQVMGRADLLINRCTMLFATVLTATDLLDRMEFIMVAGAIVSGAAYFGAIILLLNAVRKRLAEKQG